MSVTLHTTVGDLKIEIFCESVPKTAENFLAHCAKGTYNHCKFHRVIKDFMAQTGDPTGKGKGGESIWGGTFQDEIRPALRHNCRGVVSMANRGTPDSNGSQFFITLGSKLPHLDGKYTVFGRVIMGLNTTLSEIENVPVDKKNRPLPGHEIYIESVTIHANPLAD